jgi:hypothetical protein
MLRAAPHRWIIRALFVAVAGVNSGCSVTPVSVREISRRPVVYSEAANARPSSASSRKVANRQIVGKVDVSRGDRTATKGFYRSGLVIQSILQAESYEIKVCATAIEPQVKVKPQ